MQTEDLIRLIADIQHKKTESQNIEIKSAEHGCPTKLFDTLSSFSNQDDGGIIIFGIDEKDDYKVTHERLLQTPRSGYIQAYPSSASSVGR